MRRIRQLKEERHMTSGDAGQSKRERSNDRAAHLPWWAFVAGAVVLLLLISSVAWSLYLAALNRQVDAKLDEIRKAGYPATLDELNAWYAYPEGENAADVYEQAFAALDTNYTKWNDLPVLGEGTLPELGEPLSADMKKGIGEFLAVNAKAIDLLHQAAAIKGCRYNVDFSLGMETMLPHLDDLRRCSLMLGLATVLAVEDGRADDVAKAIRSGIAVADSLRNDPVIISQLVRIACLSITTNNLQRAMNRTELTPEQCADLAERLGVAEAPDTLVRAMAAERCMFYACLLPDSEIWKEEWAGPIRMRIARAAGASVKARLLWLDVMQRFMDALRVPESELYRKTTAVEAEVIGELQQDVRHVNYVSASMVFALLPTYPGWIAQHLKCNAQLRTARTALAVEQFRQEQGRLPKTLDELVPKYLDVVPPDPIDGKPIRYRLLDKGYVVYSIGRDEIDDGGAEPDENDRDKGDVPFRILR